MKFHKSIMDRLAFADVDYLQKTDSRNTQRRITQQIENFDRDTGEPLGGGGTSRVQETDSITGVSDKFYNYRNPRGTVQVRNRKGEVYKEIPANKEHEKELKNASMKSYGLFDWDNYFKSVKETATHTRITQFPASKTSHVKKEKHDLTSPGGRTHSTKTSRYRLDEKSGEMKVEHRDYSPEKETRTTKKIPANAKHEKELKNASLHAALDEILEKARPRNSERKDPNRRKAEGPDDALIIPDTKHVQTMSNPGPTEAEHYERTRGGSIENLKRLAESKHPMDRKAAAAGMKKHE